MCSVCQDTNRSCFPLSRLIIGFLTSVTLSVSQQELLTNPPVFCGFVLFNLLGFFYLVFYRRLLVPLSFLFWSKPIAFFLSFVDLRLLTTSYLRNSQTFLNVILKELWFVLLFWLEIGMFYLKIWPYMTVSRVAFHIMATCVIFCQLFLQIMLVLLHFLCWMTKHQLQSLHYENTGIISPCIT